MPSMIAQTKPEFIRQPGVIAGVAAGMARDFQLDVVLVRIVWIAAFCLGVGILAYALCWIAFPKASDSDAGQHKRISGVCLEVAKRSGQPVGVIRLAALCLLLASGGSAVIGYVLAMLILPSPTAK